VETRNTCQWSSTSLVQVLFLRVVIFWLFCLKQALRCAGRGFRVKGFCVHPGCRLRVSGICPIPCAHPLPESPLRASVKMAILVARIDAHKDPCVHLFQKWPLRASVFKSLKTNIWNPNLGFTTGVLQKRMAPLGFRLHEEWFRSIVYPLVDKSWIIEPYGCRKNTVVRPHVSDNRIQILVFSDLETHTRKGHFRNSCTQGSFWALMCATMTDARNGRFGNACAQGMVQMPDARNLHLGCTQPL